MVMADQNKNGCLFFVFVLKFFIYLIEKKIEVSDLFYS